MDNQPTRTIPWPKIIIALCVIAAVVAAFIFLPIGSKIQGGMQSALTWVHSLGFWGPFAFIAIYVFAAVFFIPGSLLTAAAGTLFGIGLGTVYVSIGSTLGATLAFLVGRYFARNWVEGKIKGNETFASIDSAVADQGWKIVGLTRLSPVFPFTLLNYAYGVTKVKLSHYIIASWIGMLPGTLLYVYIGSLGKAATESGGKTPLEWAMYGIGLLATLIVTIYITKIAKKALNKNLEQKEDAS